MVAGKHDINAEKGSTFKLYMEYQTAGATAIDMANHSSNMQVRRFSNSSDKILHFRGTTSERGLTGGGVTGSYSGSGIAGVGGIFLNATVTGGTGSAGISGGIYIHADASTMINVPSGKHFYDFELTDGDGVVIRLIEGRFDVSQDVTR